MCVCVCVCIYMYIYKYKHIHIHVYNEPNSHIYILGHRQGGSVCAQSGAAFRIFTDTHLVYILSGRPRRPFRAYHTIYVRVNLIHIYTFWAIAKEEVSVLNRAPHFGGAVKLLFVHDTMNKAGIIVGQLFPWAGTYIYIYIYIYIFMYIYIYIYIYI